MNRLFEKYGPYKGPIAGRQNGVLISMEQGPAVAYALNALEERGILFISPGEMLYEGMVIGENAKPQDLEVNPLKSKQLTNFRASGPKDEGIRLTPPRRMTPGAGDRLHPGRRAGRGDAQGDPDPQALPRSARAQARSRGRWKPPELGEHQVEAFQRRALGHRRNRDFGFFLPRRASGAVAATGFPLARADVFAGDLRRWQIFQSATASIPAIGR